jgi:hypothetical protein
MKYYYDRYWGIFTMRTHRVNESDFPDYACGFGYSGAADYLNDSLIQDHMFAGGPGALPAGTYTITEIYNDPRRGASTCALTPAESNEMFGRSGFLIHGDTTPPSHSASDGCIVTPLWVRQQFEVNDIVEVV